MEILLTILLAALVVATTALVVFARRAGALEQRQSAATDTIAAATGQPVPSLEAGVQRLLGKAEVAERRQAMVRTAVEEAAAGIAVLDPDLNVLFATERTRRMLEGRHGDAVATAQIRDLARAVFDSGDVRTARVEVYVPSRRLLAVRANRLPVDVVDGVTIEVRDVTDEDRVNAMRRDFVANVSHELKTPVGALTVLAEAISETGDDVARKRLADRLAGEAERLAVLVDDILDLSLVERGRFDMEPVDLVEVIGEAQLRLTPVADHSQVDVRTEVTETTVFVLGDRRQLVSAIANLLDNAIKYGSSGHGRGDVDVRLYRDAGDAIVEVEDHGIGIPEHHRSRIFERFYRVDRARSRTRGGTGLGLAIVRHVAINHGGAISVESTPGVGSVFRLRLPGAEA